MKSRILGHLVMTGALLLGAGVAGATVNPPALQTDEAISKQVRHEVAMYPYYGIFDNVNYRVVNGNVELTGAVTQPWKKDAIGKSVQKIPGVASLSNDLQVLPLSPMDNQLRLRIARAIYSDPALSRYAIQAIPPIHIIVNNGHVTLDGVVNNDLEKQVAGMRASTAGLSFGPVVNNLRVENSSLKKG
ncbi:MAG TPA: BON domain-containing protein [Bryobacteraceae bacterium]|jgi:hyperosmotically inducible protein